HGQSKVLIPATLATIVALIGLMLATRFEAPIWVLFLFAGLAGLEPSMMAMVRARWTEIYRDTRRNSAPPSPSNRSSTRWSSWSARCWRSVSA
ncbi:hypothetical protein M3618_22400, partial [Bacillus licheniformis]|nr:hypothetical protein [Bacillus licheniformis]